MTITDTGPEAGSEQSFKTQNQGDPTTANSPILDWQKAVAGTFLDYAVSAVSYVPDSRLNGILRSLDGTAVNLRSLTREEECVAYACGQRMANRRAAVMMQSSGLGNAVNALATLAVPYRLGVPLLISMRGTLGETNPSQIPIGRATKGILAELGIQTFSLADSDMTDTLITSVLDMAYEAGETTALIIEPELGGGRARS